VVAELQGSTLLISQAANGNDPGPVPSTICSVRWEYLGQQICCHMNYNYKIFTKTLYRLSLSISGLIKEIY
jgi:hypothetical protein